jgi:acetyltransferase-like isoleucine patch superfamily enzyme
MSLVITMSRLYSIREKLQAFWRLSFSRKLQYLGFVQNKLITRWIYSWRLKSCGGGNIIGRPLFWTPEHIRIGNNVLIWPSCRIEVLESSDEALPPAEISIGDGVSIEQRCHITSRSRLSIGANTVISFDVMITNIDHGYSEIDRNVIDQPVSIRTTQIGDYCFIGSGAKIQAGTILGRQCVVGANAVVRGHFPDYCVIVGMPARVVKRYNPATKIWQRTDVIGEFIDE